MLSEEFVKKYVKDGKILFNDVNILESSFYLNDNQIKAIENLPDVIEGGLSLNDNPIYKEFERSDFDDEFKFYKWKLKQRNIEIWRNMKND
jgi:hypothetical protein